MKYCYHLHASHECSFRTTISAPYLHKQPTLYFGSVCSVSINNCERFVSITPDTPHQFVCMCFPRCRSRTRYWSQYHATYVADCGILNRVHAICVKGSLIPHKKVEVGSHGFSAQKPVRQRAGHWAKCLICDFLSATSFVQPVISPRLAINVYVTASFCLHQ